MRYSPLESPGEGGFPQIMTVVVPTSQNRCGSVASKDEPWQVWAQNASSQVSGDPPSPTQRQWGTGSFGTAQCLTSHHSSHSLVRTEGITF